MSGGMAQKNILSQNRYTMSCLFCDFMNIVWGVPGGDWLQVKNITFCTLWFSEIEILYVRRWLHFITGVESLKAKETPVSYGRPKGTKLWTHTQLSPMLVTTMKAHTCNTKRSQKTFEPRANKPNLSRTSRNVTHTIRTSHIQVEMSHTKKLNFLRGGFGKLAC
jgi:hypothetical protein